MDIRDRIATVYLGRPNQINLSVKLAKQMIGKAWKNKEEAFAYYDKKTDRVIITRNYEEVRSGIAEGRKRTLSSGTITSIPIYKHLATLYPTEGGGSGGLSVVPS